MEMERGWKTARDTLLHGEWILYLFHCISHAKLLQSHTKATVLRQEDPEFQGYIEGSSLF